MLAFFHVILFQPILNLMVALYDLLFKDLGLAIIALTVVVRALLWPLTHKSLHSQRAMLEIQPKIKALQDKYKDQKEKKDQMAKEMMELYKNEKVSPFSSCLPLLIQLPLLIVLYQVLRAALASTGLDQLYAFVPNPGHIATKTLGLIDLAKPSIVMAVLAAGAQFLQAKMMQTQRPPVKGDGAKDEDMAAMMNKQMMYMMPAMTLIIGWKLPAGLTLYWLLTNMAMVLQQYLFFKKGKHPHRVPGVDAPPELKS